MQSNRQAAPTVLAPSAVLTKKIFKGEIGEKGTAEGAFTVIGHTMVKDSNGNDVVNHLVQVNSLSRIDPKKVRVW